MTPFHGFPFLPVPVQHIPVWNTFLIFTVLYHTMPVIYLVVDRSFQYRYTIGQQLKQNHSTGSRLEQIPESRGFTLVSREIQPTGRSHLNIHHMLQFTVLL